MERRSKERVLPIEIYTDGSLKKIGDKTFGGWGYVILRDNKEVFTASGAENDTTNQRMELMAVAEALKYIYTHRRKSEKIIVYSDSAYFINCYLQEWYLKWQSNGWTNANGKDVANQDLWREIIPFFDNFWYDFRKVEGHSNVYWNEYVDSLAQKQAELSKHEWRG
jgi:ribonuclease HI